MQYTQVTVITTTFGSDLVSEILIEMGSEGVNVVDINDIRAVLSSKQNWDYADRSITEYADERVFVKGFFDDGVDLSVLGEKLEELRAMAVFSVGSLEFSAGKIDSADWENEWRKYYAPIEIRSVAVVPAWLTYEGNCEKRVRIEPGMAFGTGSHETTGMCVGLLQDFDLQGKTAFDVGCGSGILGITALKLGAKKCVFNDIDKLAIEATEQNLALNEVKDGYTLVEGDLDTGWGQADCIVANITADILMRLCETLNERLKDGGYIVISGIINARAQEVFDCFAARFAHLRTEKKGEWQAMSFQKCV